jgi:hypothetical protein
VLPVLQVWAVSEDGAVARAQQQQFREAIIDDMTWLMRYGDVSVVGVPMDTPSYALHILQ